MKIVVRSPNWLGDIIMSFPFLHALRDEFNDAEITVIIRPEYLPLLHLLPFKVMAIPFIRDDYKGVGGTIRYTIENKFLRRSDLYFSLPPSFSSALMGAMFFAKRRVGYKGDYRSLLLSDKMDFPNGIHRSAEYLNLLSLVTEKNYTNYKKVVSKELKPYFENFKDNPYIVINPNSEASSRRLPIDKWVELINHFRNRNFVIIGSSRDKARVADLINALPQKNNNMYVDISGKTNILELCRVMAYSIGVISNDSGPSHLAHYLGAKLAVFFGAGDPNNTAPTYGMSNTKIIKESVPCSPCLKNECRILTLDCLYNIDMESAALDIQEHFNILK